MDPQTLGLGAVGTVAAMVLFGPHVWRAGTKTLHSWMKARERRREFQSEVLAAHFDRLEAEIRDMKAENATLHLELAAERRAHAQEREDHTKEREDKNRIRLAYADLSERFAELQDESRRERDAMRAELAEMQTALRQTKRLFAEDLERALTAVLEARTPTV